jgi:hypothetical protein
MTLDNLKRMTKALLIGDNTIPQDDEDFVNSLLMTYTEMSDIVTPLKWLTTNKANEILRHYKGDYYVRMPRLPRDPSDQLDIDSELVPVVARMMASNIAKDINMKSYHRSLAMDSMKKYDSKVRAYILAQEQANKYDDVEGIDDCNNLYQDGIRSTTSDVDVYAC